MVVSVLSALSVASEIPHVVQTLKQDIPSGAARSETAILQLA